MVINDHDHPAGLRWSAGWKLQTGVAEELSQTSDFFNAEIVGVWVLKESPLRAYKED
jgi:hypothetical protein